MQKWNVFKQKYEPYEVPKDWNVKTFSYDMNEVVNCAHCGKPILYGQGYTSREIHTKMGFGYSVCPVCYEEEWKRDRSAQL